MPQPGKHLEPKCTDMVQAQPKPRAGTTARPPIPRQPRVPVKDMRQFSKKYTKKK